MLKKVPTQQIPWCEREFLASITVWQNFWFLLFLGYYFPIFSTDSKPASNSALSGFQVDFITIYTFWLYISTFSYYVKLAESSGTLEAQKPKLLEICLRIPFCFHFSYFLTLIVQSWYPSVNTFILAKIRPGSFTSCYQRIYKSTYYQERIPQCLKKIVQVSVPKSEILLSTMI